MSDREPLLPPHGGYRGLKSFQVAQLAYDLTVRFCKCHSFARQAELRHPLDEGQLADGLREPARQRFLRRVWSDDRTM